MSEAAAAPMADSGPLAIVCGSGTLPFAVADAVAKRGRRAMLFGLRGWADPHRVAAYPHHWVAFGQIGRFCRLAQPRGLPGRGVHRLGGAAGHLEDPA